MDERLALLLRREVLTRLLESMSAEERREMVRRLTEESESQQLAEALDRQSRQIQEMARTVGRHSWFSDFGANIAGNAAYDAGLWVLKHLLRSINK